MATMADIDNTFLTNEPANLTISCRDGRSFKVPKSVLCSHSPVLAKMCEIDMVEKNSGLVEHKVFDGETMQLMVHFVYTGAYLVSK